MRVAAVLAGLVVLGGGLALGAVTACGGAKRSPPGGEAGAADDPWAGTPAATAAEALAGWRADLATIDETLRTKHPGPFARTPEPQYRAAVEALAAAMPGLTDDERIVGLARIVALVGDAHTILDASVREREPPYPLAFGWFTDGLVVIAADDAHREAIGWRLVDVGGTPVAAVIDSLSSTVGWESEGWRKVAVARRLSIPLYLRGTGLAPADEPARFGLVDGGGARHELAVAPVRWRPAPTPPERTPLYRQKPQALYWSRWLDDAHALYVQYNVCADAPELSFADFTRAIAAVLDQHPEARLVVDLRGNGGGNSLVMRPLLDAIAARPALAQRLFVLLGRNTFSSGLMNAIELDQAGALLLGEPAGSPASHFGEVKRVALPAHGLALQHSTRRFTYDGYPGPAVAPEVTVELSSADWLAGRDPVLAAALARPLSAH